MHGVQDVKEVWSRSLLLKFLEAQKTLSLVLHGLLWKILPSLPGGLFSSTKNSCRWRRRKVYNSTAPIESRWFSGFMIGTKHRMGVVRRQYKLLMVNQLLLIGEITEEDWSKPNYEEEKKELEPTISFATIAFCVSL